VAGSGKKNCDDAIVTALAAGGNVASAARHAGVHERTVERRLKDPAFRARVDEARAEMVRAAVGRLAAVGALAADKLHALLGAKAESVQLGAARSILDYMLRGAEIEVLAREVADLKRLVAEVRHDPGVYAGGAGPAAGGPPGGAGGPGDERPAD
jgi:hypothetical protein